MVSAAAGGTEARETGREKMNDRLHATLKAVNFNNKVKSAIEYNLDFEKNLMALEVETEGVSGSSRFQDL